MAYNQVIFYIVTGHSYKYLRPALTTDSVIFGFDGVKLQVLLVKRGIAKSGKEVFS